MRFIIIGAGGIGSYYGTRLQQAGHEVLMVARGEHLARMQSDGLQVHHPEFVFHAPVTACCQQELMENYSAQDADLIILTLKASQTASVLHDLHDWLASTNTPLLSLQNGVDNEIQIAECVGRERTVGGLAVRIGGHIVQPGVVEATGPAQIIMGAWPRTDLNPALQQRLEVFASAFNAAGIPTRLTARIQHELWLKLLINNGVNPLSALTGLDTRTLTSHPVYGDTVYRLMQEAAAAAQSDGEHLSQQEVDSMYQLICQFDAIKTSMLVDKEKDRPLETAAISGAVLRRCRQLGIPAPLTAMVDALLTTFPK